MLFFLFSDDDAKLRTQCTDEKLGTTFRFVETYSVCFALSLRFVKFIFPRRGSGRSFIIYVSVAGVRSKQVLRVVASFTNAELWFIC